MSCVESETREVILAKLHKEIERKVGSELDHKLTALASRKCMKTDALHLESIENELYEKYKNIMRSGDEANFTQEVFFTNYDGYDFDDYETMIESISSDKSAPVKLKALHKLLDSQVIDVMHKRWHRLAKNLQHCLISTNDEVFTTSLKMHYKIISIPGSSCEGYLSLAQGLEMIFNNRCFLNKQHFDANNKLQNRAVQVVKVLLKAENFVLKNLVQSKLNVFEEFLVVFFMLACRGQENSTLFEILSVLDSKASWFSGLCYSVQTRNVVLRKCVNVVKIAVSLVMGHVNKVVVKSSSRYKIDVSKQSHAIHIITEILKYEKGQALFPLKLLNGSNNITINQLLLMSLAKINESQTRSETKKLLLGFIESLTDNFESETLNALLSPFSNINLFDLKQSYQTVENNAHVIKLLNLLCSKKPINLLYGYHKQKPLKHKQLHSMSSTSPLQIISDLAIACVRHFINICELEHQVKETVIELLHCCKLFYAIHPVSFLICNPDKFICCIKDFHDTIANYNVNLHYKLDLSNILSFFIANYPTTLRLLSNKTDLLNKILNCAPDQQLIPILANDIDGYEILKLNAAKITRPYLERIWMEEDNIWEESFERALWMFLGMLQVVALNFKTFEAFVTSESEATLVGSDAKPAIIAELLEAAVNSSDDDFCVTYVALRAVKQLLVNPDVAVFLENMYNLQESLQNSQERFIDVAKKFNSVPIIIDELSCLRLSIIKCLNFNAMNVCRESSALQRRNKLSELQQFLNKTKSGVHDKNWLFRARKTFRHTIESTYNMHVLVDLIEHMEKFRRSPDFWREEGSAEYVKVSPEDCVAIKQIVKLGIHSGQLSFATQCEENLLSLLQQFYVSLNVKREGFVGFPWIVGVVFVICSGNIEKSKKVLATLLHHYLSIFWPPGTNDESFSEYFYRQVMVTLEDNFAEINEVSKIAGISVNAVGRKWLQQCFFNILDLEEICSFLMLSVLFPVEYSVGFLVSVFAHIKQNLFELAQNSQLHEITAASTLVDFRINKYISLIDNLSKQYKTFFCY